MGRFGLSTLGATLFLYVAARSLLAGFEGVTKVVDTIAITGY